MLQILLRMAVFIAGLALGVSCSATEPRPSSAPNHLVAVPRIAVAKSRLAAVEIFDTAPDTVARVMARHGDAMRRLQAAAAVDDRERDAERALVDEIRAGGDFAYAEPSMVGYYETGASYLTIDLVDRRDAERRMPFRPPPTGSYPDPDGLLLAWHAYEAEVLKLLDRGQLKPPPADCPSFQCLGDPRQPELQPLAAPLANAAHHAEELATIVRNDKSAERRAAAAFVLAYVKDGEIVVADLLPALHDPSGMVRNNAMRVLAEIALHHPEIDIPIEPVIEALGFPSVADRNKAAAALCGLVGRPRPDMAQVRRRVASDAGSMLLAMLRLQQPNNHDWAYKVFTAISGQRYGERDYTAWQTWLDRTAAN
jgi:hypothetical protein